MRVSIPSGFPDSTDGIRMSASRIANISRYTSGITGRSPGMFHDVNVTEAPLGAIFPKWYPDREVLNTSDAIEMSIGEDWDVVEEP